MIFYLIKFNME